MESLDGLLGGASFVPKGIMQSRSEKMIICEPAPVETGDANAR